MTYFWLDDQFLIQSWKPTQESQGGLWHDVFFAIMFSDMIMTLYMVKIITLKVGIKRRFWVKEVEMEIILTAKIEFC